MAPCQTLKMSGKHQGGRPIRQDQLWWTDWLTRLLCSQLGLVATCAGVTRRVARASLTALSGTRKPVLATSSAYRLNQDSGSGLANGACSSPSRTRGSLRLTPSSTGVMRTDAHDHHRSAFPDLREMRGRSGLDSQLPLDLSQGIGTSGGMILAALFDREHCIFALISVNRRSLRLRCRRIALPRRRRWNLFKSWHLAISSAARP